MEGLINDILFHYTAGELSGRKDPPAFVHEKEIALEALLQIDQMDLEANDRCIAAILDFREAVATWGFMLGLQFARELDRDLNKITKPPQTR